MIKKFLGVLFDAVKSCLTPRRALTFDNGRKVIIGKQIAEGGFSFVFEAYDADTSSSSDATTSSSSSSSRRKRKNKGGGRGGTSTKRYALKRVHCPDSELIRKCREEAGVHRTFDHPNLLPLLGLKFDTTNPSGGGAGRSRTTVCYMLFPFLPNSLRDEITRRKLLREDVPHGEKRPWPERMLLEIFHGISEGVHAMHDAGLSHRDVKLENVLLDDDAAALTTDDRAKKAPIPVLMDFGSVGPLTQPLRTRSDVLSVIEEASTHTTLPYRPPELFEGGIRHGPEEADLDGRKVDVWSLGCVLFGMMYGVSPFECEFRSDDGNVRVVECTQLRVLGNVPTPPSHCVDVVNRYSQELNDCVKWILTQDRVKRPSLDQVMKRIEELLEQSGGSGGGGGGVGAQQRTRRRSTGAKSHRHVMNDEEDDDLENPFGSLLNNQNFV